MTNKNGNPQDSFKGNATRLIKDATPWWPESNLEKSHGKPNVVIIYCDDLGFSDLGCFGGEIETPNIDALAGRGLRFANYTTVPMCSPARAALLTGKNPHSVGCGWIAHSNPGYPGYSGEIAQDAPTLAEILAEQGYTTMMVGKWHNTWSHNVYDAGDRRSWPLQRGFHKFYGFLDAETNYFNPHCVYEGNQVSQIDEYPEDHFATDDWTNRALSWMREHHGSDPTHPFFMYIAYNAPHMPHQAKPNDMAKYKGRYAAGWDAFRQSRLKRQHELGILDTHHVLGQLPDGISAWDDLPAEKKELFSAYMELYAGLVDNIDQNVGRVVEFLKQSGQIENTIIVLSSDNGANAVGGLDGTPNSLGTREGLMATPEQALALAREGRLGSSETSTMYPVGWTQVSNTPFRYFKRTPMNGGIRVPFIVHAPKHIADQGAIRKEWIHVTDVTPTLLDLLGIAHPDASNGFASRKPDGVSFAKMLTDQSTPTQRARQHYELEANCAIIDSGWKLVSLQKIGQPYVEDNWMLFDLTNDPCENNDLASLHPDKVVALKELFDQEAKANAVYPLDNRTNLRALSLPPYLEEFANSARTFYPGMQTIGRAVVAPLIADRNFVIDSYFNWQAEQQGVIFAIGDVFVGLAMYVMQGKVNVVFHRWMAPIELPAIELVAGPQKIAFEYEALGKRQGRGRLIVNGELAPWVHLSPTIIGLHFEGLDVGLDRRQRTSNRYAGKGTFAYSGSIDRVVLTPGAQASDSFCNKIEARAQEYMRD